jgi:hypothetical protein
VQILQHEDERPVGRQRFQRVVHLPQHPLGRRAEHLALQRLPLARGHEPRHLGQPERRHASQNADHALAARLTADIAQRFEPRQVGFGHAVVLGTLPTRQPQAASASDSRDEGIHQRRLPDSRLARDE